MYVAVNQNMTIALLDTVYGIGLFN